MYTVNLKWDTVNFPFIHYYPGDGTYTVTAITNAWGCQDSVDTVVFDVLVGATGIGTIQENVMSIYPNPNAGTFSLSFIQAPIGPVSIQLVSSTGEAIFEENHPRIEGTSLLIQTPTLPSGLYMLEVSSKAGTYWKKVFIR